MIQPNNISQRERNLAFPGPDDPARDWGPEEAAYARERDRLVRDHLGKFVAIHEDEIIGPFDTLGEAFMGGYHRLGDVPMIYVKICPEEPPDFVGIVDLNHPSMRQTDR